MVMAKGLTSFSTCTSLGMAWQATRELINTFLAELRLTVSGTGPALFGVPSELHRGLEHLAPLPVPCGGQCPERVPFHFTCSQQIPGSPSPTWEPIPYLEAHPVPGSPSHTCKPIPYMGAHPIPGSPSHIWEPILYLGAHPLYVSPSLLWEPIPYVGALPMGSAGCTQSFPNFCLSPGTSAGSEALEDSVFCHTGNGVGHRADCR